MAVFMGCYMGVHGPRMGALGPTPWSADNRSATYISYSTKALVQALMYSCGDCVDLLY